MSELSQKEIETVLEALKSLDNLKYLKGIALELSRINESLEYILDNVRAFEVAEGQ